MHTKSTSVNDIIRFIVTSVGISLTPVFFLPITPEYFITNKFYFLALCVIILAAVSIGQLISTRHIKLTYMNLDKALMLLFVSSLLTTLITTPNKIQALLNVYTGPLAFLTLLLLYFFISRSIKTHHQAYPLELIYNVAIIVGIATIFFFFDPFVGVDVPATFSFLKNPLFTPLGSQVDLAIFLGFFFVYGVVAMNRTFVKNQTRDMGLALFHAIKLFFILIALIVTLYTVFLGRGSEAQILLPPLRESWAATFVPMQSPLHAVFGVGVDNYSYAFSQSKTMSYNLTPAWEVTAFHVSRSAALHILTELGIFGFMAFVFALWHLFAISRENDILVFYVVFALLLFPPSFPLFFLFFVLLGAVAKQRLEGSHTSKSDTVKTLNIDLRHQLPLYVGLSFGGFLLVILTGYFLGRMYLSEVHFERSLNAIASNNINKAYESQRSALILNPFNEQLNVMFSRINLEYARELIKKRQNDNTTLSEKDQTLVARTTYQAIEAAQEAVALNKYKAQNHANLAYIYSKLIGNVENAEQFTVQYYQKAMEVDPRNPNYLLNLGGVFFAKNNYDGAVELFGQASILKPDWANARYNLAWAYFMRGDYALAIRTMEQTLDLLDPETNSQDFEQALAQLEEFKAQADSTPEEKPEKPTDSSVLKETEPVDIAEDTPLPDANTTIDGNETEDENEDDK